MELPPELTRIPRTSLDVLRYMGSAQIDNGDSDALADGTGMSSRGIGKAIRGLVTKGYLGMDGGYVYHLTEKGSQAIMDIAAYDDFQASQGTQVAEGSFQQDLIAVAPASVGVQNGAALQVGMNGASGVTQPGQLVLRFSSLGGEVSPAELTLSLQPGQEIAPGSARVTADGQYDAVRVRVEAIQLIGEQDMYQVGGIFFDVPVGQASSDLQAWHGSLILKS